MKINSIKNIAMSVSIMLAMTNIAMCSETSIMPLLFFIAGYVFLNYTDRSISVQRTDRVLAVFFSLFVTLGNFEKWMGRIWLQGNEKLNIPFNAVLIIIGIFGLYNIFSRGIGLCYINLKKVNITHDLDISLKKMYALCCGIFAVFCGIAYLTYYPGVLSNDSFNQIGQILGRQPYNNHHPIAHTMLIQIFISLGSLFSENLAVGIALYTLFQNIVTILVLAFIVTMIYKYTHNKWVVCALMIYYILNPVYVMYAQFMSKDVIFGLCVAVYILLVWNAVQDEKEFLVINRIGIFVSAIGFCLLRTNGILAFIIMLPFLFVCFRKFKSVIICSVSALLLSVVILGPVYGTFVSGGPDILESLSIPMQQIARTAIEGKVTEEQKELLSCIIPYEEIEEVYDSDISDPIKNLIRKEGDITYLEENKGEFLKLYLEMGLRNPNTYLFAFVDQTKGYWYPDVKPYIWNTEMAENGLGIVTKSFFPDIVAKLIDALWKAVTYIPGIGLLKSIGALTWILLLQAGYCVRIKEWSKLVFFIPVFANSLTLVCSSPLACSVRYAYPLFVIFPLLVIIPFLCQKKRDM